MTTDKENKEQVWQMRKDAHQVHHQIADFIIHQDDREHPKTLAKLVGKYRKMMADADVVSQLRGGKG